VTGRRFWNRWTAIAAATLVGVAVWTANHRASGAWCSKCWARYDVDEYGFALSYSAFLRLWTTTTLAEGAPKSIGHFIASDHVHDSSAGGGDISIHGLSESGDFEGPLPYGGFAWALIQVPDFATYLDGRLADGSLDIDTVRALIAVPPERDRAKPVDERLLDKGRKLFDAFHPPKDERAPRQDVWRHWSWTPTER
jgi:hypothetical protein